jgi:hypothetical protein
LLLTTSDFVCVTVSNFSGRPPRLLSETLRQTLEILRSARPDRIHEIIHLVQEFFAFLFITQAKQI